MQILAATLVAILVFLNGANVSQADDIKNLHYSLKSVGASALIDVLEKDNTVKQTSVTPKHVWAFASLWCEKSRDEAANLRTVQCLASYGEEDLAELAPETSAGLIRALEKNNVTPTEEWPNHAAWDILDFQCEYQYVPTDHGRRNNCSLTVRM